MKENEILIERIKYLRMRKEKTQKQIADVLNIPLSTYRNYEQTTRNFPLDLLPKIAKFFKVTTDYLLGQEVGLKDIIQDLNLKTLEDLKGAIPILLEKYDLYFEDIGISIDESMFNAIVNYIRVLAESKKYRELKAKEKNDE